eukprot:SAG31_NODE_1644_length_7652_cov_2.702502_9_plen_65_part_00
MQISLAKFSTPGTVLVSFCLGRLDLHAVLCPDAFRCALHDVSPFVARVVFFLALEDTNGLAANV